MKKKKYKSKAESSTPAMQQQVEAIQALEATTKGCKSSNPAVLELLAKQKAIDTSPLEMETDTEGSSDAEHSDGGSMGTQSPKSRLLKDSNHSTLNGSTLSLDSLVVVLNNDSAKLNESLGLNSTSIDHNNGGVRPKVNDVIPPVPITVENIVSCPASIWLIRV